MNTIELIYQSSHELSESERLEVFGYINMIKARFGRKKETIQPLPINQENLDISQTDKSEQIYRLMSEIADDFKKTGRNIDMDEFEKSRQDRELDR